MAMLSFATLMEIDELDIEDEIAAGFAKTGIISVGKAGGDPEAAFFSPGHELEAFGPALDDRFKRELSWLFPFVGAVENSTVSCFPFVVDLDGAKRVGRWPSVPCAEQFVAKA